MRLPPTPCRVCFRPCVFNKFSHFWQNVTFSEDLSDPGVHQTCRRRERTESHASGQSAEKRPVSGVCGARVRGVL